MKCIKCGKTHEIYKNDFYIITIREFYGEETNEEFVCKKCAHNGSVIKRLISSTQEAKDDIN